MFTHLLLLYQHLQFAYVSPSARYYYCYCCCCFQLLYQKNFRVFLIMWWLPKNLCVLESCCSDLLPNWWPLRCVTERCGQSYMCSLHKALQHYKQAFTFCRIWSEIHLLLLVLIGLSTLKKLLLCFDLSSSGYFRPVSCWKMVSVRLVFIKNITNPPRPLDFCW